MKHREHLKELVKERTTELRMVNERLQQEITAREGAKRAVQEAREYAESIVETVREPLVVPTAYLKVVSANYSFYNAFKVTPEETIVTVI
jgi:PAS domain-containing protein